MVCQRISHRKGCSADALDDDYDDMPSPSPRRQCKINDTTTRVTMTTIMMCHRPHPLPLPLPLPDNKGDLPRFPCTCAQARVHMQNHRLRVYAHLLASAPHLLIPAGKPMRVRVRVSSGIPVGKPVPAVRVWVFWRVGYGYSSGYPQVTRALAVMRKILVDRGTAYTVFNNGRCSRRDATSVGVD